MANAMMAAEELALVFDTVAYDGATAMSAGRRQRLDGTFKTIVSVRLAVHDHLKGFVVLVAACFALAHTHSFRLGDGRCSRAIRWQVQPVPSAHPRQQ